MTSDVPEAMMLVLSLCTSFIDEVLLVGDASMVVNYGLNRLRFTAPVRVGSRLRGVVELAARTRPACAAEIVGRYLA
jgi:acyl dehydratase